MDVDVIGVWREVEPGGRVVVGRDRGYRQRHPEEDRAIRAGDELEVLARGEGYILFASPGGSCVVEGRTLVDAAVLIDEDFEVVRRGAAPTCECRSLLSGHEAGCPFAEGGAG